MNLRASLLLFLICLVPTASIAQTIISSNDCSCPDFWILASNENPRSGEIVELEIASNDKAILEGQFVWTVSGGDILSGQGTRKIAVRLQGTGKPISQAGFGISRLGRRSWTFTVRSDSSLCRCKHSTKAMVVDSPVNLVNNVANVTDLKLSASKLVLPCRPGQSSREGSKRPKSMIVDVATKAFDREGDVLTFSYTVSGGRLVGTGQNVKWDLNGLDPGKYTITAGVDDGCGLCGKTWTEDVTVSECEPACGHVECPTITITGPDILGEENTFTTNISGGSFQEVSYDWVVTDGEIVSGQGTPLVKVKLRPTSSITVKVGGLERGMCINTDTRHFYNGVAKP